MTAKKRSHTIPGATGVIRARSPRRPLNRFLDEYSDDLGDVERSHTAKKFDRHATRKEKREEKKAILSVNDLKQGSFVDSSGPRDFTQSSWLDTDDVMDRGSVFTPPIPIWVRFAGRVSSAASCSSWASPASSPRHFCRPGRPCSASSSASRYSSAPVACSSHTAAMTRPSGMRKTTALAYRIHERTRCHSAMHGRMAPLVIGTRIPALLQLSRHIGLRRRSTRRAERRHDRNRLPVRRLRRLGGTVRPEGRRHR